MHPLPSLIPKAFQTLLSIQKRPDMVAYTNFLLCNGNQSPLVYLQPLEGCVCVCVCVCVVGWSLRPFSLQLGLSYKFGFGEKKA